MNKLRIVDSTLRDGEQRAGIALGVKEKVEIAKLLDSLGIFQLEAGTPAMGGEEKKSISRIMELGLKSRVSTWNRMCIRDIQHSLDCKPDIIHISAPVSDIQIRTKLNKSRGWVIENLKKCVNHAVEKGFNVTVGFEDASRADFKFLMKLIALAFLEGAHRVRYADTVGVLYRKKVYNEITKIKDEMNIEIEMHAHNDLGMAVANSLAAAMAGADYIDCTIGGIGERAGNCDFVQFIQSAKSCLGAFRDIDLGKALETQGAVLGIIYNQ